MMLGAIKGLDHIYAAETPKPITEVYYDHTSSWY